MSQVKVKSFVFELKMCLTVMTLDNSKHCHLEQILFSLELSRYQGLTVFIPGILDKGKFKRKFVLILDTENITDVLEKMSWFNLEAFTFENMKISLKAFINLTHRARETPYGAHNCLLRIPDIPIWCLCVHWKNINKSYYENILVFKNHNFSGTTIWLFCRKNQIMIFFMK